MGKTPKPLNFLIDPACVQTDEDRKLIEDLRAQGHVIHILRSDCSDGAIRQDNDGNIIHIMDYDIILSPHAWRAFDLRHLDLAIKSARAVKFPKGPPKVKKVRKPRARKVKDADNQG